MNTYSKFLCFGMLALAFCPLPAAHSQSLSGPRAYYGDWTRHPTGYYYRPYYFKPHPEYHGYKHHDVIHYKSHYYYYNPYSKKIWGRCSTNPEEQQSYYELKGDQQIAVGNSGNVKQILGHGNTHNVFATAQPSSWPAIHSIGSPTTPIPTSVAASDTQIMEPPPDDPPPDL